MNFKDKNFAVTIMRDVQYGVGRIHQTTEPRDRALCLDIYMPQQTAGADGSSMPGARPALILAFGGAFHRGSKEKDEFDIDGVRNTPVADYCHEFARRGYVAFSIDYRLVQEDPAPGPDPVICDKTKITRARIDHVRKILGLEPATNEMIWAGMEAAFNDMRTAFEYVVKHAATYGVDPTRIAVGGFSAGARMASAAVFAKGIPAAAVVALSGTVGVDDATRAFRPGMNYPPVMMVIGENDLDHLKIMCNKSHEYFRRIGVASELWEAPGATHFYPSTVGINRKDDPSVKGLLEETMSEFLWRSLRLDALT